MKEYICIYDEDEMHYVPNPYLNDNELIRCKDCVYFNGDGHWCDMESFVESMDYCSGAERKDE